MATTEIIAEAHRILNAPRGSVSLCTWGGYAPAEQRRLAQEAIDGETADFELMLAVDAAELYRQPDWFVDRWYANWQPTASESTSQIGMSA